MLEVVEGTHGFLFIRQHNFVGFSPLMSHKPMDAVAHAAASREKPVL